MISSSFHYLIYGLRLQSDRVLPELIPFEDDDLGCDIRVTGGRVELPPRFDGAERGYALDGETGYVFWRDTGFFELQDGKTIVVEAASGVGEALLRPFLLGPVLNCLLHQRGLLVLHASAVAWTDATEKPRGVAFLGQSLSGKSTMASALYQLGHLSLCDDVIAVPVELAGEVRPGHAAKPLIFPGLPHLKLRPPTIEALGQDAEKLQQWHPSHDGLLMRLPQQPDSVLQGTPLGCFYLLETADALNIEPLGAGEALMALANNSYCVRVLSEQGRAHNFLQCAALAHRVPGFRLQRPRDLTRLNEVARLVEDHQNFLFSSDGPLS